MKVKSLHPQTPVKHLLVDLDGTLLGNRALALSIDFLRHAYDILKEQVGFRTATQILIAMQRELRKPSAQLTNELRSLMIFAKRLNLPMEETRSLIRESLFTIFPKLEKHFYPIDGAKDFLDWAREHYSLTLATNPVWPREIIELRVRWAGIEPGIFRDITYAKTMHAYKPSLEYYEEVLNKQGFSAGDCLLIGNDLKMDLPATRAGIRVFIVGSFKQMTPIDIKGSRAPAWKGTYAQLRGFLENNSPAPSA
jgi:FMN phosphatase YigB (HAD superfamily)